MYKANFKLGILGGGQLGKMLVSAANQWDIDTYIMDASPDCPAATVCTRFFQGNIRDEQAVYEFGKKVDILTIEIETVNTTAMKRLQEEGLKVYPQPEPVETIKDKGLQKQLYQKKNLPTADFHLYPDKESILQAHRSGDIKPPFVQKLRRSGYDGRGVAVIKTDTDLHKLLEGDSLMESMVDIKKELSVITARNKNGEVTTFPPVEMVFHPEANLVEYQRCPAGISNEIATKAQELGMAVMEAFQITGLLAVEMFLDQQNNLLINEVAPRPHNSGHHTIEAAYTSQYEQLLRAINNFPLGSTKMTAPSVMVNLLGSPGFEGAPKYKGFEKTLEMEGVNVHLYGKKSTRPFRKMGHATIIDNDLSKAQEKAQFILENLKVKA